LARISAARTATDFSIDECIMKPVDPDAIIEVAQRHCQ
jgi:hypothetical protein